MRKTFIVTVDDPVELRREALRRYLRTGGDIAGARQNFGTFRHPHYREALWEVLVNSETPEYYLTIEEADVSEPSPTDVCPLP